MELDELISIYRESGAVVAKLSLPDDYNFYMIDICEQAPDMLEIFTISTNTWVRFLPRHAQFKHLCDMSKFSLDDWINLVSNDDTYLADVDFFSYPKSDYENESVQYQLRVIARNCPELVNKIPFHYLNAEYTYQLMTQDAEFAKILDPDTIAQVQNRIDEFNKEAAEFKLAVDNP